MPDAQQLVHAEEGHTEGHTRTSSSSRKAAFRLLPNSIAGALAGWAPPGWRAVSVLREHFPAVGCSQSGRPLCRGSAWASAAGCCRPEASAAALAKRPAPGCELALPLWLAEDLAAGSCRRAGQRCAAAAGKVCAPELGPDRGLASGGFTIACLLMGRGLPAGSLSSKRETELSPRQAFSGELSGAANDCRAAGSGTRTSGSSGKAKGSAAVGTAFWTGCDGLSWGDRGPLARAREHLPSEKVLGLPGEASVKAMLSDSWLYGSQSESSQGDWHCGALLPDAWCLPLLLKVITFLDAASVGGTMLTAGAGYIDISGVMRHACSGLKPARIGESHRHPLVFLVPQILCGKPRGLKDTAAHPGQRGARDSNQFRLNMSTLRVCLLWQCMHWE